MDGLAGVARWKVVDLPVGSAAVGMIGAGVGDGLATVVGSFLPMVGQFKVANLNVGAALLRGGIAYGVARMDGVIGREAASLGCLFLTGSAIASLFDIRLSISNIITGILGQVRVSSPGVFTGAADTTVQSVGSITAKGNPGL